MPRREVSEAGVRDWLARLARAMLTHQETVLVVERMQPSWLQRRSVRLAYVGVTRVVAGALFGLAVASAFVAPWGGGQFVSGLDRMEGLAIGVVCGGAWGLRRAILDALDLSWTARGTGARALRRAGVLLLGIALALVLLFVTGTVVAAADLEDFMVAFLTLLLGGGVSLLLWRRGRGRGLDEEIRQVEALRWSWRGLLLGVVLALAVPVGLAALLIPLGGYGVAALVVLVPTVVLIGVVLLVFGGLRATVIELRSRPLEGLRLSARNALLAGSLLGAALAAVRWTLGSVLPELPVPHLYWTGGLVAALWFGGLDVLSHYVLRLLLAGQDDWPLDLVRELDHATDDLRLLRRVGGGYMFLHRYLLEYFASQGSEPRGGTASQPASR